MHRRLSVPLAGIALVTALAGCYGGDSSPEEAGGGGIPPQSDVSPYPNPGESEGFPDADTQNEANADEATDQ